MAMLKDGYQTTLGFTAYPSITIYPKTLTPPGVDSGGVIDISTMANSAYRTFFPKSLKTLSEFTITAGYDPAVYTDILAMVGSGTSANDLLTFTFPDGSYISFWGTVSNFAPQELSEGEHPVAELTITPTLVTDAGVETAPVIG